MQTETFLENFSPTFPAFPGYICPGDYRRIECGRYTVTARIVDDTDTRPDDFDCYTPEQLAAWERGEWFFVGIVLSVSIDGYTLDDHAASLWGIDCNHPGGDSAYIQEIANDLLPEALTQAKKRRAEILAALA